jgi:sugar lactone lactonase YvrE
VKISRTDAKACRLGESPIWDVAEQALYYIDGFTGEIHRFDPRTGKTQSWKTPGSLTTMVLREPNGAVLCMKDAVYTFDFATGAATPLTRPEPPVPVTAFNDGKVDRRGRFVIGFTSADLNNPQPTGGLYSLAKGRLTRLDKDIYFSNSPCFAPDGKTLYFSDSYKYHCYAYDYDLATGRVGHRRVFADTRELGGMPDGATVDADGLVWIAIFLGKKIAAFRPDGKLERVIDMPVTLASSVSFGGPNLDQLYVTTIDGTCFPGDFKKPAEEGAGNVYVIEGTGNRGLAEPRYAG